MTAMRRLCAWSVLFGAGYLLVVTSVRAGSGPSFVVSLAALGPTPTIIAFGDSRFTERTNVTATNPMVRQALIARLVDERPDAVLMTGDLVWRGQPDDYQEYAAESEAWRTIRLRV